MEKCGKTIYANAKVLEAIRDQDVEITVTVRKAKAKVVVLGNSGVGKTSIIYRHRFGERSTPFNATIGASFVTCDVDTPSEEMRLQIWDTAGQERFRCMVPMYMRNAAAAIIVYDVTNRQSFLDVDKWANELQRCCGDSDPVLILIGNKTDLVEKRQIAKGEGVNKALRLNARFYEISSDDHSVFNTVLEDLAQDVQTRGLTVEQHREKMVSPTICPEMEIIGDKQVVIMQFQYSDGYILFPTSSARKSLKYSINP
ncbi:unnamed protein product [Auanema sp. JU1783]|nr:unnamed protein product [Auanema sp. JU1783]